MTDPTSVSFAGQLAFARLLLACLFAGNVAGWVLLRDPIGQAGAFLALLAIGAAWLAQGYFTADREPPGAACRFASIACAAGAAVQLLRISI